MTAQYLDRRFSLQDYNCWDFTREVWLDLTGRDLGRRTPEVMTKDALLGRFRDGQLEFTEIAAPREPCLVLMEQRGAVPHVGVFTRGGLLQLRSTGVSHLPLSSACLGYRNVRYFQ